MESPLIAAETDDPWLIFWILDRDMIAGDDYKPTTLPLLRCPLGVHSFAERVPTSGISQS